MASGDRQRTWFPEMVDLLRGEWRSDTSWDEIIALRDRVDDLLQHIRTSRKLEPVVCSKLCSRCGKPLVQGGGKISVRAMLLSVKRFEIASQDEVKLVERGWRKYRKETGADLYGRSPASEDLEAC